MAILVDITERHRFKSRTLGVKIHTASGEPSPPITVVDVNSPPLEHRDEVRVTVAIEVPNDQGPAGHDRPRAGLGKPRVESPVPRSIPEINLDTGLFKSDQNQVQMAVPVDIRELGCDIPVLTLKDLFGEATPAIAQESLDASEVACRHDVRESVAVDVAGGEGGVADIGPRGCDRPERSSTVTEPHAESRS